MRPSQNNRTNYESVQPKGDQPSDDPKGQRSIKATSPRIRAGKDDPNPNDGEGQPVPGAYPEARIAKAEARIADVNRVGAEAAGVDGMKKNSDF